VFGVVQTAALVDPRVMPFPSVSRAKRRFTPGLNGIDPLAEAKKAKLRVVPAAYWTTTDAAGIARQLPRTSVSHTVCVSGNP
jgi:hypothetical protein